MRLRDLFSDDAVIDPSAEGVVVRGLAVDSRTVKPGDVFFALAGSKTDGTSGLQGEAEGKIRQEVERFAHIIFASSPAQRLNEVVLGGSAAGSP